MESAVEPLTLTISLRMVRSGPTLLYSINGTKLFDNLALKIPALIAVKTLWYPVPYKPFSYQYSCYCSCFLVSRWNGLGKLCEHIRQDEDIFKASMTLPQESVVHSQNFEWILAIREPMVVFAVWALARIHLWQSRQ